MWNIEWRVKEIWVGELGLQNADLADITRIRPGTIGDIMKGIQESISLQDLAAICQATHRNIEDILVLVKDTDELDGDQREEAIFSAVQVVRAERKKQNKIRREKRLMAEERRIFAAVEKILMEHGVVLNPTEVDQPDPEGDHK